AGISANASAIRNRGRAPGATGTESGSGGTPVLLGLRDRSVAALLDVQRASATNVSSRRPFSLSDFAGFDAGLSRCRWIRERGARRLHAQLAVALDPGERQL